MGYGTNGLSFNTLRNANEQRLPMFKNSKGEVAHTDPDGFDWSVSDWFEAVVGEVGEFGNLHKKFRRGDISEAEFMENARKELADVQIYLDILAKRLGINLGEAVIAKFNETSEKIGVPVFIGQDDDWHTSKN